MYESTLLDWHKGDHQMRLSSREKIKAFKSILVSKVLWSLDGDFEAQIKHYHICIWPPVRGLKQIEMCLLEEWVNGLVRILFSILCSFTFEAAKLEFKGSLFYFILFLNYDVSISGPCLRMNK